MVIYLLGLEIACLIEVDHSTGSAIVVSALAVTMGFAAAAVADPIDSISFAEVSGLAYCPSFATGFTVAGPTSSGLAGSFSSSLTEEVDSIGFESSVDHSGSTGYSAAAVANSCSSDQVYHQICCYRHCCSSY